MTHTDKTKTFNRSAKTKNTCKIHVSIFKTHKDTGDYLQNTQRHWRLWLLAYSANAVQMYCDWQKLSLNASSIPTLFICTARRSQPNKYALRGYTPECCSYLLPLSTMRATYLTCLTHRIFHGYTLWKHQLWY